MHRLHGLGYRSPSQGQSGSVRSSGRPKARALHEEFNELTQPEYSLYQLRRIVDADLSSHDLDGPFPRELISVEGERGASSRFHVVLDIIERENPTIRRLLHRLAGARGHWVRAGTPEQIAHNIQEWFDNGAADGFNVMPPYLQGGFDVFAEEWCRSCAGADFSGTTMTEQHFYPPWHYFQPTAKGHSLSSFRGGHSFLGGSVPHGISRPYLSVGVSSRDAPPDTSIRSVSVAGSFRQP